MVIWFLVKQQRNGFDVILLETLFLLLMNRTGTYAHIPGQGLVKVSDEVPHLASHVWTPKGDVPYYDKGLRMRIESKAHKRQVLKESGLKEGGIIRGTKRWEGHTKNPTKPTLEQRKQRELRRDWVRSQGGAEGLLNRLGKQGGSNG